MEVDIDHAADNGVLNIAGLRLMSRDILDHLCLAYAREGCFIGVYKTFRAGSRVVPSSVHENWQAGLYQTAIDILWKWTLAFIY